MMDSRFQHQLQALVLRHTGLVIRESDWPDCLRIIEQRAQALDVGDLQGYYAHLNQTGKTAVSAREWQYLYRELTTGETYFFRDRNQLQTIFEQLLPLPSDGTAPEHTASPSLRLWSAGCSTGEEPYSIAMMLHSLMPDLSQWEVLLLATDLSKAAIDHARRGIYRDWSFRETPPPYRQRYFQRHPNNTWEIDAAIRRQVTFRQHNLLADCVPNPVQNLHAFDVIICRNVFIYFNTETITQVLAKFWEALVPGGYLITGHGELYEQDLGGFKLLNFPESVVLQRPPVDAAVRSRPPVIAPPVITPSSSTQAKGPRPSAPSAPIVLRPTLTALAENQTATDLHYRSALAAMEQGNFDTAIARCKSALDTDATAVRPLYLWASLSLQQQDLKQSKTLLKKILLLDATFIAAYVRLGEVYTLQQQQPRAQKMYITAQNLLQSLPAETPIDYEATQTAGELKKLLQRRIQDTAPTRLR